MGENTSTGAFLNGFVDRYSDEGHKGIFIGLDEFQCELSAVGFNVECCELVDVPWLFPDIETMGVFCRT